MEERKIIAYGNPWRHPVWGFPTELDFRQWITTGIFTTYRERYHYTQRRHADLIVLSRDGWAHGHFEVDGQEIPTEQDKARHPKVKCTYPVRLSVLYETRVRLKELGIKVNQVGVEITAAEFEKIINAAGHTQAYYPEM